VGDSPMAVAFQHVSAEAVPPSTLNPDVPPDLDAVVAKAMRKDPDARYQTAAEMRSDLLSVLAGQPVEVAAVAAVVGASATRVMEVIPPPTVPPDEVYRQLEEEPPSQIPFMITALALLVGLGILIFLLFQNMGRTDDVDTAPVPSVVGMSEILAATTLINAGFTVDSTPEASDEVAMGLVIRTDPVAGTDHPKDAVVHMYVSAGPEEVEVPPVVGLHIDEARRLIELAGLEVGTPEYRADSNFAPDHVISQTPVGGVNVGLGLTVNLVVSTGPETVVVPDLVGKTEREATLELQPLGLAWRPEEETSSSVAAGRVIRTDPPAGATATVGQTVLLVISLGPPPVAVPNLQGMSESQARSALEGVGLVPIISATRQPVTDEALDGLVVNQLPVAGLVVPVGTTVTVTLGIYEPPPTTTTTTIPETTTTTEGEGGGGGDGGNGADEPDRDSAVVGSHQEAGGDGTQPQEHPVLLQVENEPNQNQNHSDQHQSGHQSDVPGWTRFLRLFRIFGRLA